MRKIAKNDAGLLVISGGEPFEHPDILCFLDDLIHCQTPFRIATGGGISLTPYLSHLVELARNNANFRGLSLGTDIISSRCTRPDLIWIWTENLQTLKKSSLSYSVTLTLGPGINEAVLDLLDCEASKPEFFYLRDVNHFTESATLWKQKILAKFGEVEIIDDSSDAFDSETSDDSNRTSRSNSKPTHSTLQ